jgi:hypothetical protein
VVTHGRLLQVNAEWRTYGQGMNRIRHCFLELAPEMEPYFVLPASDDPWVTLAAVGVQTGANPWWQALLTAGSMIVVVNSVLAGVVGGLLWRSVAGPSGPLALALAAAVGFLGSLVSQGISGQRAFRRELEASTVAFPAGPAGKDPADGGSGVTSRPIPRASSHTDQPMEASSTSARGCCCGPATTWRPGG